MPFPAVQVVWFKRDLRIEDHRPLRKAAEQGPVLPLYVVEPELWAQADQSGRQWSFIAESLQDLTNRLAELGQPLLVRTGSVVDVLRDLSDQFTIAGLWSHEETGNAWTYARDLEVKDWCRASGIPWDEFRQDGVVRRLKSRNGWAKHWDQLMAEPLAPPPESLQPIDFDPGRIPSGGDLGLPTDPCPGRQKGGRTAARQCLESFLAERGKDYRWAMSSPLSAQTACSRLSPYLAHGVMSMREVAQATWARQAELKQSIGSDVKPWQQSMRSFSGRLHWHCHFMQKLESEPRLEFKNLHPGTDGLRAADADPEKLAAWSNAETGLPFVDACMRSLRDSGWINFRMRAMLMAVSSHHLWLPWRRPGEHLARLFTDYEPGIHWPQVQMQSGTTGINTVRIYNPVKQGHDHDPNGSFIRRWLPELAQVPDAHIHEPWTWDNAGTVLGRSYPFPVIDHLEAAKSARQKIWAVRKSKDFRAQSDRIQTKHGSRKSGVRMRGRTGKKVDDRQLSLSFDP